MSTDEDSDALYEVEKILAERVNAKGIREYFIRWVGYDSSYDTWEPEANMKGCEEIVREFQARQGKQVKRAKSKTNNRRKVIEPDSTDSDEQIPLILKLKRVEGDSVNSRYTVAGATASDTATPTADNLQNPTTETAPVVPSVASSTDSIPGTTERNTRNGQRQKSTQPSPASQQSSNRSASLRNKGSSRTRGTSPTTQRSSKASSTSKSAEKTHRSRLTIPARKRQRLLQDSQSEEEEDDDNPFNDTTDEDYNPLPSDDTSLEDPNDEPYGLPNSQAKQRRKRKDTPSKRSTETRTSSQRNSQAKTNATEVSDSSLKRPKRTCTFLGDETPSSASSVQDGDKNAIAPLVLNPTTCPQIEHIKDLLSAIDKNDLPGCTTALQQLLNSKVFFVPDTEEVVDDKQLLLTYVQYPILLHALQKRVSMEIVQLLISHGVHLNYCDDEGTTPLIYAAGEGMQEVCECLLEKGVLLNFYNAHLETALTRATKATQVAIVRLLLRYGVNISAINSYESNGAMALSRRVEKERAHGTKNTIYGLITRFLENFYHMLNRTMLEIMMHVIHVIGRCPSSISPVHILNPHEAKEIIVHMQLDTPQVRLKPNERRLLLLARSTFHATEEMRAELTGNCFVESVTVNDVPQGSFMPPDNFIMAFDSIILGENRITITFKDDVCKEDPFMRLIVAGYRYEMKSPSEIQTKQT